MDVLKRIINVEKRKIVINYYENNAINYCGKLKN